VGSNEAEVYGSAPIVNIARGMEKEGEKTDPG
jgi:hypothetical protein